MPATGVLFVPHRATLQLLDVEQAFGGCEQMFRLHAKDSIVPASSPSFKLDAPERFDDHGHVKGAFFRGTSASGIRLSNGHGDGVRNTVGMLDCAGYIVPSMTSARNRQP